MSSCRAGFYALLLVVASLVGCAEVPVAPLAPAAAPRLSAHEERIRQAIAKHQQLAREYRQSGDLASAAVQWQLVTLLAPGDASARQELAATRAEIARRVQENLAAGNAAVRAGDNDKAADAMLKVLALDPENTEAANQLREIEKRRAARVQAGRAAKVNNNNEVAPTNGNGQKTAAAAPRAAPAQPQPPADVYDYEQPLELFKAGDTAGGLRDLRRFVDANPNDRAARNKIGNAVYDRAREIESQGAREEAFTLYEQAVSLRGDPGLGWSLRIQSLRKSLSEEYFEKGTQLARNNLGGAIKEWETSLRFDPQNSKAATRLKEAKATQEKLLPPPGEKVPPKK